MLKKSFIVDAAIILFVTVVLFFIIELTLRYIFPEKIVDSDSAYSFDEEVLVSLKPNISKKFERQMVNGGETIIWKSNSLGFRGEELQKNPDIRVMVYGDSNIQARFSYLKNTYPEKLEGYLKEDLKNPNIEVINAGLVGAGPDQNMLRLKRDIGKYKPDIVVFHVFVGNDYGDIVKNRLFNLNSSGDIVPSLLPSGVDPEILKREGIKHFISSLLIVKATKKLILPKKITVKQTPDEWLDYLYSNTQKHYQIFKNNKPKNFSHFGDYYDVDVAAKPEGESSVIKIQIMRGVLLEAFNFAKKNNVKFLIQIQPSVVDLAKNTNISYDDLKKKFPDYKPTNLTNFINVMCMKKGIPCINLYDVYSKNKPGNLYFRDLDSHWNDAGQDLAAKETSGFIINTMYKK